MGYFPNSMNIKNNVQGIIAANTNMLYSDANVHILPCILNHEL